MSWSFIDLHFDFELPYGYGAKSSAPVLHQAMPADIFVKHDDIITLSLPLPSDMDPTRLYRELRNVRFGFSGMLS